MGWLERGRGVCVLSFTAFVALGVFTKAVSTFKVDLLCFGIEDLFLREDLRRMSCRQGSILSWCSSS